MVAEALYKNLDLKLLHSSMQTSVDYRSRRRHVSRMTDEKGDTWSRLFRCSVDHAKRSFYRAANSIFSKIGRIASEKIVLQL